MSQVSLRPRKSNPSLQSTLAVMVAKRRYQVQARRQSWASALTDMRNYVGYWLAGPWVTLD
jgi:hypothetical protein